MKIKFPEMERVIWREYGLTSLFFLEHLFEKKDKFKFFSSLRTISIFSQIVFQVSHKKKSLDYGFFFIFLQSPWFYTPEWLKENI